MYEKLSTTFFKTFCQTNIILLEFYKKKKAKKNLKL